jgi:hypothetical protein
METGHVTQAHSRDTSDSLTTSHDKTVSKPGIKGNFLNPIKGISGTLFLTTYIHMGMG